MFQKRPLSAPDTLGERLRQLREEERLTIEALSRELRVPVKYLQAIEQSQYGQLPGLVYARNFTRLYAHRMHLNLDTAMERFQKEYAVMHSARGPKRPLMIKRASTDAHWVQRHARLFVALLVVAAVGSYFAWQVYRLLAPPKLVLQVPARDVSTNEQTIRVVGQTVAGAVVEVNNQAIIVQPSGQFQDTVDLRPGLNTLNISAKTKFSRARTIRRFVLVEGADQVSPVNTNTVTNENSNVNGSAR